MLQDLTLVEIQEQANNILDTGTLQLLIGLSIGLAPTVYNYLRDKTRWKYEKEVVHSQEFVNKSVAIENIASAVGQLLEQSQKLSEKNLALIASYEKALEMQGVMFQQEKELHAQEIEALKLQISNITKAMVSCSSEILNIIVEVQKGKEIPVEKLTELENKWKDLL